MPAMPSSFVPCFADHLLDQNAMWCKRVSVESYRIQLQLHHALVIESVQARYIIRYKAVNSFTPCSGLFESALCTFILQELDMCTR